MCAAPGPCRAHLTLPNMTGAVLWLLPEGVLRPGEGAQPLERLQMAKNDHFWFSAEVAISGLLEVF